METEKFLETPEQYFNSLYETGSSYLILGIPNSRLKVKKVSNFLMYDYDGILGLGKNFY